MMDLKEEKLLFDKGVVFIGGVDEVGRGPLAGPVVAACVAIGVNQVIDVDLLTEVNDSKKISEKKREHISDLLLQKMPYIGIGVCDNKVIDKINILAASFLAMKRAVAATKVKIDFLLVDGNMEIKNISVPQRAIIKGDSKVFCIAAASIVAKVYRDKLMMQQHDLYPNYAFNRHKGYGTTLHMERINLFGVSPIHRRSFKPITDRLKASKGFV